MTRECEFSIELPWHTRPHLVRAQAELLDEELYLGKVRLVRTDLAGHAFGERVLEFNRPARSHREWKLEDDYCAARSEMDDYIEALRDEWADREREREWLEKHYPDEALGRAFEW